MTPLQKLEPSEFVMNLVILAWKLPDLSLLCSVCVLSSVSLLSPILGQLPTSFPTPHPTPSNSGSAEHLAGHYWGSAHRAFINPSQSESACDKIIHSLGRGKGLVESGMEQPSLHFSAQLSFLTWAIPLAFPLEFLLHHYHRNGILCLFRVSFCCEDVWHISYHILAHSICHCGVPLQR